MKKTGKCYLETFDFRCSFTCWLKTVSINYCRLLYRKDTNVVDIDGIDQDEKNNHRSDISPIGCEIREIDENYDKDYVAKLLPLMKNPRYRDLLRYRYIEEMDSAEVANMLDMTMNNYYYTHKRALEHFVQTLRREGHL